MKALILDSGTLINFSMNGLLYIFEELKKISEVKFIITKQVKYEILDRPIGIPRFELGALRIQSLIESGVLELPNSLSISEQEIKTKTKELMDIANSSLKAGGKFIKIVSDAEMSCLALSEILTKKQIPNLIAVDERTTRILSEKPENLEKLMSKKLHSQVTIEKASFGKFKNFKFIRSTELAYVAHKLGILEVKGPKALEAVLFATKFKGSSVSFDEINVLKKL
ncbi:MAG: hypothetical protein ABIG28_00355 [archaeon]